MTSPWVAACCTQAICPHRAHRRRRAYHQCRFASRRLGKRTTAWGIPQNGSADFRSITADEMVVDRLISDTQPRACGDRDNHQPLATISRDFTVSASATLYVHDLPGAPDTAVSRMAIVRLRHYDRASGPTVEDCWETVSSYSDSADGEQSDVDQTVGDKRPCHPAGHGSPGLRRQRRRVIMSTVQDATGAPYIDIATWTTDLSDAANIARWWRLGNLAGVGLHRLRAGGRRRCGRHER